MARPKRTKIKSAPTRVAKTSRPADPGPRERRVDRAQEPKAGHPIDSFSEDSDGLVSKSTQPQTRMPWHPEPQHDMDVSMTGALPMDNSGGSNTRKRTRTLQKKTATPPPNTNTNPRATRSSARRSPKTASPADHQSVTPSAEDGLELEGDSTSFGDNLLTFTSLDSDSPAHGTRPPSAIKVGATPAHEASILALTKFKRRARQPSLLRMVQQTTDVEDNDLDDLDDLDNLDLDDFHPDDESTPLHVRNKGHGEGIEGNSGFTHSSSVSRGRKRKLSSPVVQVPRSSPPYDSPSGAEVTRSRSSSLSLPGVIGGSEEVVETQERADLEILSDTMAPPKSSSPPAEEVEVAPESAAAARLRRQREAPRKEDNDGDSEAEDEAPTRATRGQKKAHHGISTIKLQALLPRRRMRPPKAQDEYDIQSTDAATPIDSDQDELQLPSRRQKAAPPKSKKKHSRGTKKAHTQEKATQKNTRTYGRRVSSDKENASAVVVADEEPEDVADTAEPSIVLPPEKLTAISKKFEDVDAWEMDFESVDLAGESSSPWR